MEPVKPFSELHHVSLVVRDVDATVRFLESLGMGPFFEYPPMTEYTKLNVPDKDGFFNTVIKCVQIGPVQLQLVQPGEGRSIYGDFLEKNGEGVFHLGFVVPDIDAAEAEAKGRGLAVISSGFSYFGTADTCGVVLLARQSPPAKT